MENDARARDSSGGSGERHVDWTISRPADFPESCRVVMTQHGAKSTREHRRHPCALMAEVAVADSVNTAMKGE